MSDTPIVSFGIVADVQYSEEPSAYPKQRPTKLGLKKLPIAIQEFNKHNLDFVVNLGDTIDHNPANFPAIISIFNKSTAAVWHVLGNHDFSGPDNEKGYKEQALAALGLTDDTRYTYRDVNNWRFIILDTNEVGTIEHKQGTPEWHEGQEYLQILKTKGKVYAEPWNGGIGDVQKRWLQATIDDAKQKESNIVVFAHHGVAPIHRHLALNCEEILGILDSEKTVKAYINGHNHDGDYAKVNGLHCLTVEGMLDFKNKTAYAIARIYDNRIEVTGYGRVTNRVMNLR